MAEAGIAAEVVPTEPGHAGRAAKALQQRGFRVLHVGSSISVQAPRDVWESTFGVTFAPASKLVQPEIGRTTGFLRADPATLEVPPDLAGMIADVAFAEPPDLH